MTKPAPVRGQPGAHINEPISESDTPLVATPDVQRHGAELMSDWITKAEDDEVNRILRLSHRELVAEIEARGENVAEILAEVQDIYNRAKRDAYARGRFRQERT